MWKANVLLQSTVLTEICWIVLSYSVLLILQRTLQVFLILLKSCIVALLYPADTAKNLIFWVAVCFFSEKYCLHFFQFSVCFSPRLRDSDGFFFFLDKKSKFSWSYKLEVLEYLQNASYFKRLGLELTCTLSQDCIHKLLEAITLNCSPHISFQILPQSCDGSFLCVFIS